MAETSGAAACRNFLCGCGKSDKFSALSTPIITQQSSGSGKCLELGFTARMQLAYNKSWTFPSWPMSLSAEREKPSIFNSILFFSFVFYWFLWKVRQLSQGMFEWKLFLQKVLQICRRLNQGKLGAIIFPTPENVLPELMADFRNTLSNAILQK